MSRRKTISDEAVLEAALGVMVAKGPTAFTLADVAAAAGIAAATLLQRFGDKRRLILAAFAKDNAAFARRLAGLPPETGAEAVIAIFRLLTPDTADVGAFSDQLLWLRQDMRDPDLNALARDRFEALRAAIAARLPPLAMPAAEAARLVEAQWQGALNQWGIAPEGELFAYVARSLRAWFALVGAGAGLRGRSARQGSRR